MTPLVILLVVLVNVCNVFADTLIVSGGFSSIGDFEDSSMVRYNGWYFDKDYHVQLQSGKIYSMCQSRGATYLGGDFVAYTYQGTSQYFMHTNSYFPSNPPNNPPVIVVPVYGYSNDYQLYTYYTWTHDDYDEDDTDEYMDDDDDDDDDGLFDDDDDDDDDDGGGGDDDDDDDGDDGGGGDDRKRGVRKREGHFIDGVYYDYPLRNGTGTNTTTTNGTTININPNLDGAVYDLFCLEEFVVVAGNFTSANNVTLNNVGMWQTGNHTWMPFGTGLNGPVYAIAAYGQFFYMGGAFNLAGGFNDTPPIAVSNLARWGFVNQTWSSMNVNISGTILDMAISQDGSLLFIGGNFTVPSIMKGLGHIRNFLVIDLTTGSIANTEGTNGTVRKLFIRHNQPGVVVAGNFGLWGFDEVRVWIDDRKWEPYNILFAGEVTTISVFNNGDTIAVGGQFEAAIVDGKWRQMYYLAIKRGDSAWEEVENINGPVYAMLSQVTSRTLLFAFIIAGLGVTVLCWFTIPCRATPHTTSPHDHVNHSKMPKFSFLFLPFMAVVALACALHLPFILMSIPKFQGAFDSFERFQFLFEITHLWTPVLHIDLLVGFMLSCPFIAPPLMGAIWYMGREGRARIQYNYSFKFRHARSLAYALACFDVWLLMLLVYYLASPLPDFLGRNSFLMGACFVVIEAIVAFLLARTVNFNKNGDTSIYLMLNSSFYISSRIALASLLAISPSIPNAISFFVPCISFILHLIRHIGNSTSSKRIVYRSISDGGEDESEYELPAQACFTKVQKVIFNVRNAAAKNEAYRAIMIYKQFLETVIDFFFLSGYNPLTPFFLMAFATCHYVMISRERAARAVLGGVTHATFTFTLVLCTFGSPMAPGLFMSWRSPVMLSSLFASVLLSATCISYTVFSRKVPFVQWTFGIIYLCMGLVAYAMVWTYAGNWSTEVPLIVYAITLIIVIGSIYAVKRYM